MLGRPYCGKCLTWKVPTAESGVWVPFDRLEDSSNSRENAVRCWEDNG